MRILNKHSHWWKEEEKVWVTQDKDGRWWIWRAKDKSPSMKPPGKRRKGQTSNVLTREQYLIIALASALGISVGLNIIAILS